MIQINWHIFTAAISSASIEFLETAVLAYAVAASGYPREAIWGSVTGMMGVGIAALVLGKSLQWVPLHWLQIGIGLILLGLGWKWAIKSLRRQAKQQRAGWMSDDPLGQEGIALEQQQGFSQLNFLIMTKSAALEAFEVAVIITTLGLASSAWYEALGATVIALLLSLLLVAVLHRYLLKVPEVLIKLGAGLLLCALGTFWFGEGLRCHWWFGDLAILGIVSLYSLIAILAFLWLRTHQPTPNQAIANQ